MGSNYFLKHTISHVGREKSAEHMLHLLNALLLRQLGHGEIEQNYTRRNTAREQCFRGLSQPPNYMPTVAVEWTKCSRERNGNRVTLRTKE